MGLMQLSALEKALDVQHLGDDATFEFVSIDTRTLSPGELFIALRGPNFDGHNFIDEAREKGAVAVMVSRDIETKLPTLKVDNTRVALGKLGALRRSSMGIPVLAVTGSCGKTTSKSMMASILDHCGQVHANMGTFNNDYGVPLTLMGMTDLHDYAVVEMGANHMGEIAYLTDLVKPDVAVITMVAPVHIEGFGSLAGIAKAKAEIFQGLSKDGTAILNADDGFFEEWKEGLKGKKILTFGFSEQAEVCASRVEVDEYGCPRFHLETPVGDCDIKLPLLGEHNIVNALASAAATIAVGADLKAIKKGLETVSPVAKRMIKKVLRGGAHVYDDTYNANPAGVEAALKVLSHCDGQKILVMGEMGELGSDAQTYHQQLGKQAKAYGVSAVYAYGPMTEYTAEAFGPEAHYFTDQAALIKELTNDLSADMQILVKGSRFTKMENVVQALLETKGN